MKIIKESDVNLNELIEKILQGRIFIYPTDTIYGLGCNAMNKKAVNKIKKIKAREKNKPFSVIAPSFKWIKENLIVGLNLTKYLPGPYTVVLKKKNPKFLSWVSNKETLGVRIPDHGLCKKIQKSRVPFITTSVNLSRENPINSIKKIPKKIKEKVDIIIDEGVLDKKPSILVINGKEIQRN